MSCPYVPLWLRSYILARLLLAPLMLWVVTTAVFLLLRATPGDPVDALLGPRAPQAAKDELRNQLGLGNLSQFAIALYYLVLPCMSLAGCSISYLASLSELFEST